MFNSSMFDVKETTSIDNGIQRYEYHAYEPVAGNSPNSSGELRITISQKDLITHPSQSYILFEGRLTKSDGSAYADGDKVALVNNGLMYLFDSIKYQFGSNTLEHVTNVGQATTMLGLLKYSRGFSKAQGLNQLWYKDTDTDLNDENQGYAVRHNYIIERPTNKGAFSFIVPLKHIFGFADDYDKIVYGVTHSLIFTRRTSSDDAIIHADGVADGKVTLTKLQWYMPHVNPSDEVKLPFFNTISSKETLQLAFRSRKCEQISVAQAETFSWTLPSQSGPNFPRFIVVGFQTAKDSDQKKNAALFDHCNVTTIRVKLDSNEYPEVDYDLSFQDNMFARAYRDAALFSTNFYALDELVTDANIPTSEYRDLYPLFVFDVSKQVERLKVSTVGIRIEAKFKSNPPANTSAYALIISDCICSLRSNGTELSLIN